MATKNNNLCLDDFDAPPKLKKTTLLGKAVYLRELSFDDQMYIGNWKGTAEEGSKLALCLCLCHEDGTKMFTDPKVGLQKLGNLDVSEIWNAIKEAAKHSGLDGAVVKKKSKRSPGKRSR